MFCAPGNPLIEVSARLIETSTAFALNSLDLQVMSYQPTHLLLDFPETECEEICRRIHWWKVSAMHVALGRHVECPCLDALDLTRVRNSLELWLWLTPTGDGGG